MALERTDEETRRCCWLLLAPSDPRSPLAPSDAQPRQRQQQRALDALLAGATRHVRYERLQQESVDAAVYVRAAAERGPAITLLTEHSARAIGTATAAAAV